MSFPAVAVLVGASALANVLTAYSNYQSQKGATSYAQDFYSGASTENSIFWRDYQRAHGWNSKRQIRYPYRTGYNYNLSALQNAGVREVSSKNNLYRAITGGLVSFGYSARPRSPRSVNIYNY